VLIRAVELRGGGYVYLSGLKNVFDLGGSRNLIKEYPEWPRVNLVTWLDVLRKALKVQEQD
jgi:hypothetical protein